MGGSTVYVILCYVLQANFKQLLSEMGRKGFVEQLTMVLHQVSILVCAVLYQVLTITALMYKINACSFQVVTISHGLRRKC